MILILIDCAVISKNIIGDMSIDHGYMELKVRTLFLKSKKLIIGLSANDDMQIELVLRSIRM